MLTNEQLAAIDNRRPYITCHDQRALIDEIKRLRAELARYKEDSEFLSCLRAAGVDNWDGYSDACQMMEEA